MDKKWINLSNRLSDEYVHGVVKFLDFAFVGKQDGSRICCPCKKCRNRFSKTREDLKLHCLRDGFDPTYKNWTCHGETYIPFHRNEGVDFTQSDARDDMESMLRDALRIPDKDVNMNNSQQSDFENVNGADKETKRLLKLLRDAEIELFPGCKRQTKLSFIARLLHLKVLCHWSNNSVDLLLELLKDSFPDDVNLPANYYEANKITTELGFTCQIIDACPNNCMLFRGEDGKLEKCEICGESRYKNDAIKVATKRMRYFPLKPRLQKLFMSSKTSSLMRWHVEELIDDGVLRHPADSLAWKNFDERNPTFANDIRNVRLGLATDGFNPFGTMNVSHSIWPIVLMTYNLPPWLCMKQPSFILSIIIDGPKGPGNKIDVYMQPLIDELKELWNTGVQTYDSSSDQLFQLHAVLLWTISDFPGYGNLSGWSTRGVFACPNCGLETRSKYLKNGHKFCYCGHRRFLPTGHKFRRDKISFDGSMELSQNPSPLSEMELLQRMEHVPTEYKKKDLKKRWMEKNNKRSTKKRKFDENAESPWKKRSILFELPYWAGNLVRHNLDVMHIEKNVCDNILFTLLGVKGKTKDNLNAWKDLQLLKIRSPLHPIQRPNGAFYLPASSFTMSSNEKKIFCSVLTDIIEIQYTEDSQFLMFKCDWIDNEKGLKQDEFKFTLVNFNYLMYDKNLPTDEPFILANQAQQVWYIVDPVEPNWNVVVTMSKRDNYDVYSTIEAESHSKLQLDDRVPNRNEDVCWVREGVEGTIVDEIVAATENIEAENDVKMEEDLDD